MSIDGNVNGQLDQVTGAQQRVDVVMTVTVADGLAGMLVVVVVSVVSAWVCVKGGGHGGEGGQHQRAVGVVVVLLKVKRET